MRIYVHFGNDQTNSQFYVMDICSFRLSNSATILSLLLRLRNSISCSHKKSKVIFVKSNFFKNSDSFSPFPQCSALLSRAEIVNKIVSSLDQFIADDDILSIGATFHCRLDLATQNFEGLSLENL